VLYLYIMYKSAVNPAIYWMVPSGQVFQTLGVMLVKLSVTLYILDLQGPVYVIWRWFLISAAVINVSSLSVLESTSIILQSPAS
jgi:hypothetical protein